MNTAIVALEAQAYYDVKKRPWPGEGNPTHTEQ